MIYAAYGLRQFGLLNMSLIDFFGLLVPAGPGAGLGAGAAVLPRFAPPDALTPPPDVIEVGTSGPVALELVGGAGRAALASAGAAVSGALTSGASVGSTRGGGCSSGSAAGGAAAPVVGMSLATVVGRGHAATIAMRTTAIASALSKPIKTARFFEEASLSRTGFVVPHTERAV